MYIVSEMAYSKSDAMELCLSLGEKFGEYFVKIINEGTNSENFNHHCNEMQAWFDKVRKIKLKQNNKNLNIEQYIDWFFTAGQNMSDIVDDKNVEIYEKLIEKLLTNKDNKIINIVKDII